MGWREVPHVVVGGCVDPRNAKDGSMSVKMSEFSVQKSESAEQVIQRRRPCKDLCRANDQSNM